MEPGPPAGAGEEFSAFIGRERELAELRALVPGTRALTLSGPAGIGKTRLALRLLAELAEGFPDGAWFVGLADLRQPDLVVSRIAAAVGVVEEPGRPLLQTLADVLRTRQILICLDNCEHLIDACARACQRLLAGAPGLRVIATSREPLRVAAETVWQVPPMALAPPGTVRLAGPAGMAEMFRSDAFRLFADRAAAARQDFTLTLGNAGPVAAICRAVDGLPLAIELAAAWVRVLSPGQIAERLADRFRLLSSAERTAPPRHRTLRAAIDWSHDLLTEPERVLLRRLSVFVTWTLEMAEQICAGQGPADSLDARDVIALQTALADKSLIVGEPASPDGTRYRMLETIREYAAGKLEQAGEAEEFHQRFADYAVRETERAALIGMALVEAPWSARVDTFRRFDADTGNLEQILGRCLARRDAEAGLRICAAMRPVWIVRGSFAEGAGWTDAFLGLGASGVADGVLGAGQVTRAQLTLATDPAQAGQFAKAGLEMCRSPGSEFWAASAVNLLAEVALHAGQPQEGEARAREALAISRGAGDRFNEAYAIGTLAAIAALGGDLARGRQLCLHALEITRRIDQQWAGARALLGLGDIARAAGDLPAARDRYLKALEILRGVNARPEIARSLAGLGRIAISQSDHDQAGRYLRESLELSSSTGSWIGVIRGIEAFAALAVARGDVALAVRLAGATAALRQEASLPEAPASRSGRVLGAAAGLGPEAVAALWDEGASLGREDAIALALTAAPGGPAAPAAPDTPASSAAQALAAVPAVLAAPAVLALPAGPGPLTAREHQVASLVAAGLTNKAIADELGIAAATAARHIANIMAKLSLRSRSQVAAWTVGQPTRRGTGR